MNIFPVVVLLLTITSGVLSDGQVEFESIDEAILAASGAFEGRFRSADGNNDIIAEFDMVLSPEEFNAMYLSGDSNRSRRKASSYPQKFWTNAIVYYYIVEKDFTVRDKKVIRDAMDEYEKFTCLTFVEVSADDKRNRIRIQNGNGCNSHLGMTGGSQTLNLAVGCRYVGTVIHELGHAIGWHHEHQLPDRDDYIEILYENVEPKWRIWFNRIPDKEVNNYGIPYDYRGIMHYGSKAFSAIGKQTIRAKDPSKQYLIQDTWYKGTLAWSDVLVANAQYQCSAHCPPDVRNKCPAMSFMNKNCQCQFENGLITDPIGDVVVPPEKCEDNNSNCKTWATFGECAKNPRYMMYNCRVSCGSCPGEVTTTIKPVTTKSTGPTKAGPTTLRPTTRRPITSRPTTKRPITPRPTTRRPITPRPTTRRPITPRPTTRPKTYKPITPTNSVQKHVTPRHTTKRPITPRPTTRRPITPRPTTRPITYIPITPTNSVPKHVMI